MRIPHHDGETKLIAIVFAELHRGVGAPRAGMGGELRRRVHPRRGGRLHRDRAEDEEGAGSRGADHEGELQGDRARQGGAGREQPGVQEEEAAVPVQGEEHHRRLIEVRWPPPTYNLIDRQPGPYPPPFEHVA